MKILVCISKSPDTTAKIAFKDNNTAFDESGVTYIVNPYDEWYALVRALELKETLGGNVTTISVGGADMEAIIRKAFAIGADDGVRIDAEATDSYFVAAQIAAYAKANSFDLVLTGKETINYNGSALGGMLAEMLGMPYISMATKLDVTGNIATIEYDIDGGIVVAECEMPLVVSAAKGMAEARIPNMRGISAARTKVLSVVPAVEIEKLTQVTSYTLSQGRTAVKMIDAENAGSLIEILHNEAKVI